MMRKHHENKMADRPYYDPDTFNPGYLVIYKPGVGLVNPKTRVPLTSSIQPTINNTKTGQYNPGANIGIKAMGSESKTLDKNYVYDLEFNEYFDLNNLSELFKNLFWNFFKNYCKVLVYQPLEIARLVLQVGKFDFSTPKVKSIEHNSKQTELKTYEESDEEINYFQSTSEIWDTGSESNSLSNSVESKSSHRKSRRKHKIDPVSKHTIDILASIAAKDGPNGLFRGLNAQFLYQTLSHTIEAWITGFLSPFLGIPDPFFLDLTHSTEPSKSLCLSVAACVLTGIILMPLDLIKIKLMITNFTKPYKESEDSVPVENDEKKEVKEVSTRSIRESIRNYPLPLLIRPPILVTCLTILHQFSTSIFRKSAPYILFIRFNIDSYSSPKLYTLFNLILLIMEFFIKLPVENLLRKEQVKFLLTPKSKDIKKIVTIEDPENNLIVDFNDGYKTENEESTFSNLWQRFTYLGLFNGWRVGVLNVIGFWGYKIMKSGGIMAEERF